MVGLSSNLREGSKINIEMIKPSRIVFHFNKAFLTDPSIPMWVLKSKGSTYYVDHVKCLVPFNTKNTPDNSHTKGSIQVVGVLEIEEVKGEVYAEISSGTES